MISLAPFLSKRVPFPVATALRFCCLFGIISMYWMRGMRNQGIKDEG